MRKNKHRATGVNRDTARASRAALCGVALTVAILGGGVAPAAWADGSRAAESLIPVPTEAIADPASGKLSTSPETEEAATETDPLTVSEEPLEVEGTPVGEEPVEEEIAEESAPPLPDSSTDEVALDPAMDGATPEALATDEPTTSPSPPTPVATVEATPEATSTEAVPAEEEAEAAPAAEEADAALSVAIAASRVYVSTLGDRIKFRVTVRNSGGAALADIALVNNRSAANACGVRTLAPGESTTCVVTYAVASADLLSRYLHHELIATGATSKERKVSAIATTSTYVAPIPPDPVAPLRDRL